MHTSFIRHLREKNKLTQQYLAKHLAISRPTYIQVERGRRDLTVPEAQKLAKTFNTTLDNLLNEVEQDIDVVLEIEYPQVKKITNEIRISVPQQQLDKFTQVLLYLLIEVGGQPHVGMTVLHKLLYFIDFDYYEKYEEQLMGLAYIKNHFGPTPIIFDKVMQEMIENNQVERIKSKYYQHEESKYLINPAIEPDLSVLNGQETQHIDWELQRFYDLNVTSLSSLSHQDIPWINAQPGKPLDYEAVFYRTRETSVRSYLGGENDSVS